MRARAMLLKGNWYVCLTLIFFPMSANHICDERENDGERGEREWEKDRFRSEREEVIYDREKEMRKGRERQREKEKEERGRKID